MRNFLSNLVAWFAWCTDAPDPSQLDPAIVLWLCSLIVMLALALLVAVAFWPLGEPEPEIDPAERDIRARWPELPHHSLDREVW